jgi:hypothetical protein
MASSLSFTFFFFSWRHLCSLSICSFIIVYRFYYYISSYSMILLNDFSNLSTSSLNFFLTFYSNFPYNSSHTVLFLSITSTSSNISFTNLRISITIYNINWQKLTFVGTGYHFVFCICMFQHTFRTEHLLVAFAEEFDFFAFMNVTILKVSVFLSTTRGCSRGLCHG